MKNNSKILWITRTAIFVALTIVIQAFSKPLGQVVTGSLVNLILVLATILGGIASGAMVALLSPLLAFILGFAQALPPILPMIMLGNLSLTLVWYFMTTKIKLPNLLMTYCITLVVAAIVKFLVLYIGVIKVILPILGLPDAKVQVLSASFSTPQLITALIGGVIATLVLPPLKNALQKSTT